MPSTAFSPSNFSVRLSLRASRIRANPRSRILTVPVRSIKQVARLDVAVYKSCFVRVLQSQSGLANVIRGSRRVDLAMTCHDVLQTLAIHVFHDEEMRLAVLIDVVSTDDVRMIEFAGRSSLPVEALQGRRVVFEFVMRQNLKRHVALMKICSQR